MEKIPQHLDDKLLSYIDGALNPAEAQAVEGELMHHVSLRNRYIELQALHRALRDGNVELPSKNFTNEVMRKLDQYPMPAATLSIRGGILLLTAVLIAVVLAAILVSVGVFDNATTTLDLNQIELSKKYVERTLPLIPFNGKLIVNIIILLNLALAWLVLDRAVLKPLFQRRMQGGQ
jgi:anti-sigma factor RsiW